MTSHPSVLVRPGPLGQGIYARVPLAPGQTILKFEGPLVSHREVLAMGDAQAYALQIGPDQYIDTHPPGRYTNHSCHPNAGVVDDRFLVALRNIAPGEEIRFDYSTTMSENHWTMVCRCGHSSCRGIIRDFHFLPRALQNHYIELGVVQRFIVEEWRTLEPGRLHSA